MHPVSTYEYIVQPGSRDYWDVNYAESTDAYEDYAEIL
jgi:hypothetical protein